MQSELREQVEQAPPGAVPVVPVLPLVPVVPCEAQLQAPLRVSHAKPSQSAELPQSNVESQKGVGPERVLQKPLLQSPSLEQGWQMATLPLPVVPVVPAVPALVVPLLAWPVVAAGGTH